MESKDLTLTQFYNENAFLKNEITRLNEESIQKNHEINRINQVIFTQKIEFTENLTF